jgi:hypothetical protein
METSSEREKFTCKQKGWLLADALRMTTLMALAAQ